MYGVSMSRSRYDIKRPEHLCDDAHFESEGVPRSIGAFSGSL
jgi:hypothetical protein